MPLEVKKFTQEQPPAPGGLDYSARLNIYLERQFRNINQLLAGGLQWQNLKSALLTGMTPSSTNTPFTLTHNLGKIPEFYLVNLDREGLVWAELPDEGLWTSSTLTLRSNVTSASFTLLVM